MRKPEAEYLDNVGPETAWPEDVARLRGEVPALNGLSDVEIDALYTQFSQDEYCAGWMDLDAGGGMSRLFAKWLGAA